MEAKYQITITETERSILIRALVEKHNQMITAGLYPDMVDNIMLKIGKAPAKRGWFTSA